MLRHLSRKKKLSKVRSQLVLLFTDHALVVTALKVKVEQVVFCIRVK
jgi:hypothetical protein